MNQNTKNKYSLIHTDIKQCEANALDIAKKISETINRDERHELLKQLNNEISSLTQITTEVIHDLLKI